MEGKVYRVYSADTEGEYTEGYIRLTDKELKAIDGRDSDYEYEEVVISDGLDYKRLLAEFSKNREEREESERKYKQWLKDNPEEEKKIKDKNKKREKMLKVAKGNITEMALLTGKFMAEDLEDSFFNLLKTKEDEK